MPFSGNLALFFSDKALLYVAICLKICYYFKNDTAHFTIELTKHFVSWHMFDV